LGQNDYIVSKVASTFGRNDAISVCAHTIARRIA
jgi:hypothetical protein